MWIKPTPKEMEIIVIIVFFTCIYQSNLQKYKHFCYSTLTQAFLTVSLQYSNITDCYCGDAKARSQILW